MIQRKKPLKPLIWTKMEEDISLGVQLSLVVHISNVLTWSLNRFSLKHNLHPYIDT